MNDEFLWYGTDPSKVFEFYKGSTFKETTYVGRENGLLLRHVIGLDPYQTVHKRQVYDILDLVGDLGGVFELLISIFSIFLRPFS